MHEPKRRTKSTVESMDDMGGLDDMDIGAGGLTDMDDGTFGTFDKSILNKPIAQAANDSNMEQLEDIIERLDSQDQEIVEAILQEGQTIQELGITKERFMSAMERQSTDEWWTKQSLGQALTDLVGKDGDLNGMAGMAGAVPVTKETLDERPSKRSDKETMEDDGEFKKKKKMGLKEFLVGKRKKPSKKEEGEDEDEDNDVAKSEFVAKKIEKKESPPPSRFEDERRMTEQVERERSMGKKSRKRL